VSAHLIFSFVPGQLSALNSATGHTRKRWAQLGRRYIKDNFPMKKVYFSLILNLSIYVFSYSQDIFMHFDTITTNYYIDNKLYKQTDFIFFNTTSDTNILWIDSFPMYESISIDARIKGYFRVLKEGLCLSDSNSSQTSKNYYPELYKTFFKIIQPNEQFIISILFHDENMKTNNTIINNFFNQVFFINANVISDILTFDLLEKYDYTGKTISFTSNAIRITN